MQSITAAPLVEPADGLASVLGFGVSLPDPGTDPLDPGDRWTGHLGYQLEGQSCSPVASTRSAEFCDPENVWAGELTTFDEVGEEQKPFVVGAAVGCSSFGHPADIPGEYTDRADRALRMTQWSKIANELWTGAQSQAMGATNRRLASPDAEILVSGDPVRIVDAVSLLECKFGECSAGAVQLIHVPRLLVPYLDAAGIIHSAPGSNRILTANNSIIIPDRGYPGTSPLGAEADAGQTWIYSTGPLTARLSPVAHPDPMLGDAVEPSDNTIMVRSERLAAISWLCCHLAVQVAY